MRLRVLIVDHPLHRRIHLNRLSQKPGPPLASVPNSCHPFVVNGDGPWQPIDASGLSVAVICWEEILEVMGTVCSEPFTGDLAQFQAMYRVLIGYDIEPITSEAEVLAWREKEGVYVNLVDLVTRRLTREGQV